MAGRIHAFLLRLESGLLVAALAVMISVAAYQVIARNLGGAPIVWGKDMVGILVLGAGQRRKSHYGPGEPLNLLG